MDTDAYLTITELNQLINRTLVSQHPKLSFSGEISQLTVAGSGHMYFTVKDEKSQLSAVMWRGDRQRLDFEPEPGMSVHCDSKPNVYHGNGRLQMVVSKMVQAGEGLLQKKFLELQAKLESEGLFDPERKRPLPFLPKRIGVVTSATGAVIHDIMTKIHERFPQIQVSLIDVRVQGEGAAQEIARAIKQFQSVDDVEVLIVGRGGGSLEDLWPFNEEPVVRAIFASKIPVISAVGHEVDVTLSDLVADMRAPTPTAAAEMAVPIRSDLVAAVDDLQKRLDDLTTWFTPYAQQVDELTTRLDRAMKQRVGEYREKLSTADAKLALLKPEQYLNLLRGRIDTLSQRLTRSKLHQLHLKKERVSALAARLSALHPESILERGFSIVRKNGKVVRSSKGLKVGEELAVSFAHGSLESQITTIKSE